VSAFVAGERSWTNHRVAPSPLSTLPECFEVRPDRETMVGGPTANVPLPPLGPPRIAITCRGGDWFARPVGANAYVDARILDREVPLVHGTALRIDLAHMCFLLGDRRRILDEHRHFATVAHPPRGCLSLELWQMHRHRVAPDSPVLAIAIDDLRDIVDQGGHPAGLDAKARSLSIVRAHTTWPALMLSARLDVGKRSLDFTIVVIPGAPIDQARRLAEAIRRAHEPGPTVTIGVAPVRPPQWRHTGFEGATERFATAGKRNRVLG
jgi:hypothetical protein